MNVVYLQATDFSLTLYVIILLYS